MNKFDIALLHIFTIVISAVNIAFFLISVIAININPDKASLSAYEVISPLYYLGYVAVFAGLDVMLIWLMRRFRNEV